MPAPKSNAEVLSLVRKLVNLGASSDSEEARTSAQQACALIKQYKFEIRSSSSKSSESATGEDVSQILSDAASGIVGKVVRDALKKRGL